MTSEREERAQKPLMHLDVEATDFFEPYAQTAFVRALGIVSKLGDQPQLRLIAASVVAGGAYAGNKRLIRAGTRMILAHEGATYAKDLLKIEIDRTRPRSATSTSEKRPKKGDHTSKEETSFPSGHSAGAIAAARAFSREFPQHSALAIGAAAAIAAVQVVRCAHYPTDVAAGLLIGLAAEAVTNETWKQLDFE